MAREIFRAISNLRLVLNTETDANSPDNETTYGALREELEILYQILLGTGFDGTVTGIATTTITHAEAAQGVDEHENRTTVITSGTAKGFKYTIDGGAAQTLIHTGDDLEADGVAINDTFVVLYDIKNNVGHTHDDVDSPNVVLADLSVATAKYQNDSVTIEKIQHGTLTSILEPAAGLELTLTDTTSFTTKATYKFYVPADATTLKAVFRAKIDASAANCRLRFTVDGNGSSEIASFNIASYTWTGEVSRDCSAISGLVELDIDLKAQGSRTLSVQGWTFWWE